MNLHDISKLPPAMQAAAMADQARTVEARERIMAQLGQPAKPVDMQLGSASFAPYPIDPSHIRQTTGPGRSLLDNLPARPAKSPPRAIEKAMQAILPQVAGIKIKQPKVSESLMQQEIVRWFDRHACEWNLEPELLMAFPLQGKRTKKSGGRLKAEGMRRGTLDMQLCVPRGDCCSLWIENKSSTGKLSQSQKDMLKRLTLAGAATVVCRSAAEAIAAITAYLNLPARK